MKKLFILLVMNICMFQIAIAQKEFNNWFFGSRSALNFGTGSPVFVPGSSMVAPEGCSSISDKQGNLLFYSNGVTVWSSNHTVMPNGSGLNGDVGSTQSVLITNHPGNNSIYYIFTVPKEGDPRGVQYSVVNMNLNGGQGDIDVALGKNVSLSLPVCEKIAAVKHRNRNDIWIIMKLYNSTQFIEYLVDCSGFITYPQNSYFLGSKISTPFNTIGYLKGSPDGKKLAMANFEGNIEVFDFNDANGLISNAQTIPANPGFSCGPYGVEFSPDSKLLYSSLAYTCNGGNTYDISQYKLDTSNIPASKVLLDMGSSNVAGALQLGPDNKIYIAYDQAGFVGAITNANIYGPGCTLVKQYINLPAPALSGMGLPNVSTGYTGYNKSLLGDDTVVCDKGTLTLRLTIPNTNIEWSDGTTKDSLVITTAGQYWVKITHGACVYRDTVNVTLQASPKFNLGNDTTMCSNKFPFLLKQSIPGAAFLWQDGSIDTAFSVTKGGLYWLQATLNSCIGRDSINVTSNPVSQFSLGADTAVCQNAPLTLTANVPAASYLWNTGSTSQSIIANTSGTYWCEAINSFGCSYRDSIKVTVNPGPVVSLGKDTSLCQNKFPLLLSQSITGATYLWQDGSANSSFSVPGAGLYWVEATVNGCSARDSVVISANIVDAFNLGADSIICGTQPLTLTVTPAFTKYLWNNGSTSKSIIVNSSGLYWCEATNSSGCSFRDSINLAFNPSSIVNLGKDTTLCQGGLPLTIGQSIGNATYLWQDGSTNAFYTVNSSGLYWVQATVNGCSARDTIIVSVGTVTAFNLGADSIICGTQPLTLTVNPAFTKYLWNTGSTSKSISVTSTGIYWCEATNSSGCSYRDSIQVTFRPSPVVNLGKDTTLCQNKFPLQLTQSITGATYLWQDGSANASISVPGAGLYWVEATVNGCSARDSILISANVVNAFNLGADSIVCGTQPLTLTVNPAFTKYLWSTGSTSKSISVSSTGLYWCEATNSSGCSYRDSIQITFRPAPVVNLGKDTAFCQGGLPLVLGQNISNASYLWQDGSTNAFFTVNGSGIYWMQATVNGCSARDSITISVGTVTPFSLGADTIICGNQPLTLTVGPTFSKYLWNTGSTSKSISVNSTGFYWCEATNSSGCSYRDTISVAFNPASIVNLGKDTTLCQGGLPLVIGQSISNASYLWQDGSTNALYTVNGPGLYWVQATVNGCSARDSITISVGTVTPFSLGADTIICGNQPLTLTVAPTFSKYLWNTGSTSKSISVNSTGLYWCEATNSSGCSYRDTISVALNPTSIVNLGKDTTLCQGGLPLVIGQSISNASYMWQDGSTNALYTVNGAGLYWVQATVNGCSARDSITISVGTVTAFSLGADTISCANQSVTLGINQSFTRYLWNTGNTTNTISVTNPGIYWLEASNNVGCAYRDSISVNFKPAPVVNLGKDTSVCQANLPFTVGQSIGGASYLWQDGSTKTSYTVTAPGLYWMQATVNGCSARDSINVSSVNAAAFNLGADTLICNGQALLLGVNGSFSKYLWSTGSANKNISVTISGDYWLEAFTNSGCSFRDSIHVDFKSSPSISLGRDTVVCNSLTYVLNVSNAGDSYLWQDNSTQPTYLVNKDGSYYVRVSKNGCSSSDTVTVMFKSKPAPDLGADKVICPGEELILYPSVTGTRFTWQDGSKDLTYKVTVPGRYTVAVANECGIGSDEIIVSTGSCKLLIPNAFTPGKRTNNIFRLVNAFGLNDFRMQVFNRWGQQVYQTANSSEGWDGKYKGLDQSSGMYVYIITYTDIALGKMTQKGTVMLIR